MKQKFCILCGELLPASRHGNATTCSPEHALLLKKHREQTNYHLQRQTSLSVLETNRTLKLLAQQFGYGVPIPADEFLKRIFQWDVITGNFEKDGIVGVAVGDHAYILFTEHKIKIYKND
jgi:hypothetical protein